MWNLLAEQPVLLAVMSGIVAGALVFGWLQSGDKRLALACLPFVLLIPGFFYIAGQIETDRERLLKLIDQTAEAVEANDPETAVQVIGDDATRRQALAELRRFRFSRVRVRNIRIRMVEGSVPQEASVDLDANVRISQTSAGIQNMPAPRRVIVTFKKQPNDRWVVTDYHHQPLVGGN